MKTYGFEREYFVFKGNAPTLAGSLPSDSCGYLAEARGEPDKDVIAAAFSCNASSHKLLTSATKLGLKLVTATPQKLPAKFLRESARAHGKEIATDFTMSGKWNRPAYQHAGLHVHFGFMEEYTTYAKQSGVPLIRSRLDCVPNIPKIVMALDKQFKSAILDAKRALGLYELKTYGFEYRSLPASLNPVEVADFILKEGL